MENIYQLINNVQNDIFRYLRKGIRWLFVLFFVGFFGFLSYPFFYGNSTEDSSTNCTGSNGTLIIIVSKQPNTGATR